MTAGFPPARERQCREAGSRSPIKYGTSFQRDGDAVVIASLPQADAAISGTSGICSFVHPHHNLLPSREKRLTETDAQWEKGELPLYLPPS